MSRTVKSARPKTRAKKSETSKKHQPRNPLDFNNEGFEGLEFAEIVTHFLSHFFDGKSADAKMDLKATHCSELFETSARLTSDQLPYLRPRLSFTHENDDDWHFRPQVLGPNDRGHLTIYGHADTGIVHPTTYSHRPIAWWETLPGTYQAIWRWERPMSLEASSRKVGQMLHEFGGVIGSHLPDAYLRIPMCPIYSTAMFPWPVARLRHCEFPNWEDYDGPLFQAP